MGAHDFLILWASITAAMLICRCAPMLLLKGRELPERVSQAINMIPAAAFAALVANDLVQPAAYAADPVSAITPLAGAAVVCVVARKTRSLAWCALTGLVAYACISWAVGALIP